MRGVHPRHPQAQKKKIEEKKGVQKEQGDISLLRQISLLSCRQFNGGLWLLDHHHILGHLDNPEHFTLFPVAATVPS